MNKILLTALLMIGTTFFSNTFAIEDEFAEKLPVNLTAPEAYTNYNFESTEKIPIKLKIQNEISSEKNVTEGQKVKFKVVKNVIYKNTKIISLGTPVEAEIGLIITNGMNGIPASIIFNNFQIPDIKSSRIDNSYEKFGLDLSLLVYPIKWLLTPLPPTGSFTNFIKGGHVKLGTHEVITIYYHPNWT